MRIFAKNLAMKFRTEYIPRQVEKLLDPEETVLLIGSCFSENIGERMRESRWRAFSNITGTLYNPASIARILEIAEGMEEFNNEIKESVEQKGNLWISWLADTACTSYNRQETENLIFNRLLKLRKELSGTRTLIVTFGTAWIYELVERPGYVVTNCHKFPADKFRRRRLSVKEISDRWITLLSVLATFNPKLRIIFTVSPVRHLKDGFEGNSISKGILRLACEEICAKYSIADYFPAFEIMNDDLRDYRFYADDLVHPSKAAVDYIWDKFQQRYLSEDSRKLLSEGEKITKRLNHRPLICERNMAALSIEAEEEAKKQAIYDAFMKAHPGMLTMDEEINEKSVNG